MTERTKLGYTAPYLLYICHATVAHFRVALTVGTKPVVSDVKSTLKSTTLAVVGFTEGGYTRNNDLVVSRCSHLKWVVCIWSSSTFCYSLVSHCHVCIQSLCWCLAKIVFKISDLNKKLMLDPSSLGTFSGQ